MLSFWLDWTNEDYPFHSQNMINLNCCYCCRWEKKVKTKRKVDVDKQKKKMMKLREHNSTALLWTEDFPWCCDFMNPTTKKRFSQGCDLVRRKRQVEQKSKSEVARNVRVRRTYVEPLQNLCVPPETLTPLSLLNCSLVLIKLHLNPLKFDTKPPWFLDSGDGTLSKKERNGPYHESAKIRPKLRISVIHIDISSLS